MHRAPALALGFAASLLAGCEAMKGPAYTFEVVDAASGAPVPGALVRLFWFDEPGDVLGRGPVEARVREVGADRRLRGTGAAEQEDWIEARTDARGVASAPEFGVLWGPKGNSLDDLFGGAGGLAGLWIRVEPAEPPPVRPRDFVVVGERASQHLVRVETVKGLPQEGKAAGSVKSDPGGGSWRIVVPVEK